MAQSIFQDEISLHGIGFQLGIWHGYDFICYTSIKGNYLFLTGCGFVAVILLQVVIMQCVTHISDLIKEKKRDKLLH